MSELSGAEYWSRDILTPNRWVEIRDDTLHLLDPATGDPLNLNQPPEWLASDPRLAEGYQALGDPAHDHKLVIALGKHSMARDLGRFENRFSWFERTYAHSDAVAFEESDGWDPAAWEYVVNNLRGRPRLPQGLLDSDLFHDRLLRTTVKNSHVADFSYDVAKTDTPLDKLLLEITHPNAPYSRLRHEEFPIQKVLQFAGDALREWYMPGKYMHELLKLDMPPSPRVLFTVGAAHKDLLRKFNILGFSPAVRYLPLSKKDKATVERFSRAMRLGHIRLQDMAGL